MTKEHDDLEPMELPDELLESVVGGLTKLQKLAVEKFARDAIRHGCTLDQAIDRALHPERGRSYFDDEMIQYMTEYWDTVVVE